MKTGAVALLLLVGVAACAPAPPPHLHGGHGGPPPGGARRLFISPMGEPFHGGDAGANPVRLWFDGADADHDGRLALAEFKTDAERFFTSLDSNGDGEIDPAEIDRYETEVAPQIAARGMPGGGPGGHRGGGMGRGGMRGGGMGGRRGGMGGGDGPGNGPGGGAAPGGEVRQGAARFSFLDIPEPVTSADTDFDRGISRAEFAHAAGQRFLLLDTAHQGYLTLDTLPPLPQLNGWRGGRRRASGGSAGDAPPD